MLNYLLQRLATIVPTLFFVSVLIFGLQQLLPGDPAIALAGEDRDLLGSRSGGHGGFERVQVHHDQLERLDPDLKREYNIETALSVQHALTPRVSVAAGWYRRSFHNMLLRCSTGGGYDGLRCADNLERDFSDYVPVQIVSSYNGEVITAYNLRDASELSKVDGVLTNANGNKEIYNGFEVGLEARLPGGGTMLGSTNFQRTLSNFCDQRDDPNELRFCDRFNLPSPYQGVDFKSDVKLAGSYPTPLWGLQVSGTFRSTPGRTFGDFARIDELSKPPRMPHVVIAHPREIRGFRVALARESKGLSRVVDQAEAHIVPDVGHARVGRGVLASDLFADPPGRAGDDDMPAHGAPSPGGRLRTITSM